MAGRQDEVITFNDALNFGPIDYSDIADRRAWEKNNLGFDDFERTSERSFWNKALTDVRPKVLWTSRRSSLEYTGFLECLWRLKETPYSVIDFTEMVLTLRRRNGEITRGKVTSLGVLSEENILRNGLFDLRRPLSSEERSHYHNIWKRLKEDNAPFRVVDEKGIRSAPIDHFDDLLISHVTTDWQKSARVIGESFCDQLDTGYYQVGDLVLFSRLQTLARNGVIESRGDMTKMRTGEVRLKQ
jgi:hypothetical protein